MIGQRVVTYATSELQLLSDARLTAELALICSQANGVPRASPQRRSAHPLVIPSLGHVLPSYRIQCLLPTGFMHSTCKMIQP